MQWFKSVMVVSSVVFVGAMAANGCSSNPTNGDAGGDAKITSPDAKADSKVPGDSGSSCTKTSGLSCEVCDVSTFSPTAQGTPIGPHAAKCASTDLSAFDTACLATNADTTTCGNWQKAEGTSNAACLSCIYSDQTAANWGPLICNTTSGQCSFNNPGCLDLALAEVGQENNTSSGSCGDLLNASYECQNFACGACGVAADGGSDETDFDTCIGENSTTTGALNNECATYANAFNTSAACSTLQGDTLPTSVSQCFPSDPSTGFSETEFLTFVGYFCGPAQ